MPVGKHGYLASPPPTRRVVARLATRLEGQSARFYGAGVTAAVARQELAAAVGAWEEERGERAQSAWEDCERLLEDFG